MRWPPNCPVCKGAIQPGATRCPHCQVGFNIVFERSCNSCGFRGPVDEWLLSGKTFLADRRVGELSNNRCPKCNFENGLINPSTGESRYPGVPGGSLTTCPECKEQTSLMQATCNRCGAAVSVPNNMSFVERMRVQESRKIAFNQQTPQERGRPRRSVWSRIFGR
jgi:RecJ-like exonuclease